jgi:UDP-N-acetylglucosamine 2-epimerase
MLDVLQWERSRAAEDPPQTLNRLALAPRSYLLATLHRSENTDDLQRLSSIVDAFNRLDEPIVFPIHPRARKALATAGCQLRPHIRLIEPVGYLDMLTLTASARLVLTDSGGLQKEAYWLHVPCVTLRDETEWVETVGAGWNTLVGSHTERIVEAVSSFAPASPWTELYGDGCSASKCVALLEQTTIEIDSPVRRDFDVARRA